MCCTARVIGSAQAAAWMRHWRREPPCSVKATIYRGISALLRPRRLEQTAGRAPGSCWPRSRHGPHGARPCPPDGGGGPSASGSPTAPPGCAWCHGSAVGFLQGGIMAREYPWNTLLTQEHGGMPEPDQGSVRPTTSVH